MKIRRDTVYAIAFVAPLAIAVLLSAAGEDVSARDDQNYLAELPDRELFGIWLDPISWLILGIARRVFGDTVLMLRLVGFGVALVTAWIVNKRVRYAGSSRLLLVSVLPVFLNIYFNQLRVAIAAAIFLWFVTTDKGKVLAAPMASLAQATFCILIVPFSVLAVPLVTYAIDFIDPQFVGAVKLLAYAAQGSEGLQWYFGWELIGLAGLLMYERKTRLCLEVLAFAWAARSLGDSFSIDVGRRILELGLLAYSPIFILLWRDKVPSKYLITYFAAVGLMQSVASLYAGVVAVG